MQIDLGITEKDDMKRAKEAQAKQIAKDYEPTWEEVWTTGWTRHTGTFKKPIFGTKMTDLDKQRLLDVKQAIETGELGTGVESMKKFSKSHALNLYKELKLIRREGIVADMIKNKPDNYKLINSVEELYILYADLSNEDLVALDTETTGLDHLDTTVGMSLSLDKAGYHVYIPYGHITDEEQIDRKTVMLTLKEQLEREDLRLVLFNAKFDAHMLLKDGIDIRDNIYFDVQIAMHVLNENEPNMSLKGLSNKYGKFFGYTDSSMGFAELFGKDPIHFIKADMRLAVIYACKDTHLTLLFYKWQMEMFDKQPKLKHVYFDLEQKNTHVSVEMERNGFAMDLDFSRKYGEELQREIQELEEAMERTWGDININSPAQLKKLFYEELGYEDPSGKGSVNSKTLEKLGKMYPDVQMIIDYRDIKKLYGTYVEPLPEMVRKDGVSDTGVFVEGDERLHGEFNQTGTVTGRYASREPNLQNLPPRARKMIVAPEGRLLIGIDLSQIEPRTLAHMSGDPDLQKPYLQGIDLYSTMASNVYNLPYEACLEADDTTWRQHGLPKHPRKLMKVGLLAVMYGISEPQLAENLGITKEQAQDMLKSFYKSYPRVSEWMAEKVAHADKHGYVETADGRKRRFLGHRDVAKQYHALSKKIKAKLGYVPDFIWDAGRSLPYKLKRAYWDVYLPYSKVERMAVNAVIQGSAADILKKAMIGMYEHVQHKEGWKMIATIHDEVLYEIPETTTPEEITELNDIMISPVKLDVPLKSDVEVMTVWGSGIPFDEWVEKGCGREPFKEEN